MNSAWIGDDERYQNANPDIDADRWLFNTQHEANLAQHGDQNCVHRVSDPEYIRDIEQPPERAAANGAATIGGLIGWERIGRSASMWSNSNRWRMTFVTTKKCPRSLLAGAVLRTGRVSNRFYSRSSSF